MNIDLHSHFFPVEALQNPGKYENRTAKLAFDKGKLSVTSQIGSRAGLRAGAYDPVARIKALDEMQIDRQAISPSTATTPKRNSARFSATSSDE